MPGGSLNPRAGWIAPAAALLLVAAGCDDAPPGRSFHYPLDGVLRLDHVQARATHNSFHLDTTGGTVPPWAYDMPPLDEQLDRLGVREVELDVNLDAEAGFEVFHIGLADEGTTCRRFVDCLAALRRFSDQYPGHLPIGVQIEARGFQSATAEDYFARLEGDIRAVFPPDRLITPDQIKGSAPSLREALAAHGWPTLGALRGRLLFAFDNAGELRAAYTHGGRDLDGRLLFVDSRPADPFAAFAVLNDPLAQEAEIRAALAAHLLVRTRADSDSEEPRAGDTTRATAALASGAHWIATDYPTRMHGLEYVFELPGGLPARCNPVTAPAACSPLALEDPAFVGSSPWQ